MFNGEMTLKRPPSYLVKEAIKIDLQFDYSYEVLASMEIQRAKVDDAIKLFEQAH